MKNFVKFISAMNGEPCWVDADMIVSIAPLYENPSQTVVLLDGFGQTHLRIAETPDEAMDAVCDLLVGYDGTVTVIATAWETEDYAERATAYRESLAAKRSKALVTRSETIKVEDAVIDAVMTAKENAE